MNIFVTI